MIYSPGRFCFIHIPRTAGNSITAALASVTLGEHDVYISTAAPMPRAFPRHCRAAVLAKLLPDWEQIYRFAVIRDRDEIIASEQRLIDRDRAAGKHLEPWTSDGYRTLLNSTPDDRRWNHVGDPWTYWATDGGRDLGVTRIAFEELPQTWDSICDACHVDRCPLPHLNAA